MRSRSALLAGCFVLATASTAAALDIPDSLESRPYGPGTQDRPSRPSSRVVPGPQTDVFTGAGFGPYGFGLGGRIGYTFSPGIYAGAQSTYYFGTNQTTASGAAEQSHVWLIGGELGYKIFPVDRFEVRPYVFLGPSSVREKNDAGQMRTDTRFAFYPAVAAAYHFGNAFIGAEARMHLPPNPTSLAIMGGAGLSF